VKLTAYDLYDDTERPWKISTADASRPWFKLGKDAPASCLPLVMASQLGWNVELPTDVHLTWDGTLDKGAIKIGLENIQFAFNILSHFGLGIVTFSIPYLFRTEGNINILARGPANYPVRGLAPLEGLIESYWSPYPFTMNWQMTEPGYKVVLPKGFPICTIVPLDVQIPLDMEPEILALSSVPDLDNKVDAWRKRRDQRQDPYEPRERGYMKGQCPFSGKTEAFHRTRLELREFKTWQEVPGDRDRCPLPQQG